MIDVMWIWGALGLLLLAAEMATGTIYLLWLGISALCMAVAVWLFPELNAGMQFMLYAFLAVISLGIWKFHYKKTETSYRVGQSQGEEIGRIGTMIEACSPKQNGKIRFTQGVMGSKEWTAMSDSSIEVGQEAKIISVEGNAVKVIPH
jgi:inner membrane protein